MKICMVVNNRFYGDGWVDVRVYKEARSLLAEGHHVTVLAKSDPGESICREEWYEGIRIVRPKYGHGSIREYTKKQILARDLGGKERPLAGKAEDKILRLKKNMMVYQGWSFILHCLAFLRPLNLFRLTLNQKADVYHAHDLNTLMVCFLASKIRGAYLIYDSHELWVERNIELKGIKRRWDRWKWRFIERFLIRMVDRVITV